MHTHKYEGNSSSLHLYCLLSVRRGPWFARDDLYGRYYAVARAGVGRGRSDIGADADTDANVDANAEEEGEAREEGNMGKDK